MAARRAQKNCHIGLGGKSDQLFNPSKHKYITIGREVPFFHDGPDTRIPVSKSVNDNAFSPSAQCNDAADKPRLLFFTTRRAVKDYPVLACTPLYETLVREIRYANLAAKPRDKY